MTGEGARGVDGIYWENKKGRGERGGGGADEPGKGKTPARRHLNSAKKIELMGRKDHTSSPPPHLESLLLAHGRVALKQNQGIPS